jgi:hypothetical protein
MALMPYEEAAMYSDAYGQQEFAMSAVIDYIKQVEADKALTQRGHTEADLTPAEIEELLAACSAALGKAHYFELNIDTLSEELKIALSDQSIQRNAWSPAGRWLYRRASVTILDPGYGRLTGWLWPEPSQC